MNKLLSVCLILVLSAGFVVGPQAQAQALAKAKLAILRVESESISPDYDTAVVSDAIRVAANKVIPRSYVRQISEEIIYSQLTKDEYEGCSLECAVEAGRVLGARYVARTACWERDDQVIIRLELYDTLEMALVSMDRAGWHEDSVTFTDVRVWAEGFFGVFERYGDFGRPMTDADLALWNERIDFLWDEDYGRANSAETTGYIISAALLVPAAVYAVAGIAYLGEKEHAGESEKRAEKAEYLKQFAQDWQPYAIGGVVASGLALWITDSKAQGKSRDEIEKLELLSLRKRTEFSFLGQDWKTSVGVDPMAGASLTLSFKF